jgi:hypothetical protein
MLWSLLPFSASFCVSENKRRHRVLDVGSMEGTGQQSHNYWQDILAYRKQSEQNCCHVGETNLQCTTCQIVFTAHVPIDIAEHLHRSIGLQFAPVERIHNGHFYAFERNGQCALQAGTNLCGLQVWRWWSLPWKILPLCFIVVPVNLMFHTCDDPWKDWCVSVVFPKGPGTHWHGPGSAPSYDLADEAQILWLSLTRSEFVSECFGMFQMRFPTH